MSIKLNHLLAVILAGGMVGFMADTASAKEVSLAEGQKIINGCDGTTWVPGATGHTSGCMNKNGSGVVCGGVTPKQKNSCSTFRIVSRDRRGIAGRLGTAKQ